MDYPIDMNFSDEKKKQRCCLVSAGSLIIDSDILNFVKNLSFSLVYIFYCCVAFLRGNMLEKHQVKNRKRLKSLCVVNVKNILNIQSISYFHLCWIYYCVFAIMFCHSSPYWDVSMTRSTRKSDKKCNDIYI